MRQGQSKKASENHELGSYTIKDIPPKPKGQTTIKVTFRIDVNCLLLVSSTVVGVDGSLMTMEIEPESVNFQQHEVDEIKMRHDNFRRN